MRRNHGILLSGMIAIAVAVAGGCTKKSEPPPPADERPIAEPSEASPADTMPPAPADFPTLKIPADNPQSAEKIALGHQLFFDKRLSVDGSRACYTCHQNEHGNGGETPLAVGAKGKRLTRHSPVIWNVGFFEAFYWDGRSGSLEAQAKGAWGGGNMGVGADKLADKTAKLAKIKGYAEQFASVFPDEGMTPDTVAKAIASYERTLVCNDTAYDRYAKGDQTALDASQLEGWKLFMGKAQCNLCHAPPLFSNAMAVADGVFYNAGIGTKGVAEDKVDVGRQKVSGQPGDWAAFKIPSLRNVAKSAPYFHDGSAETLKEAVQIMAGGGVDNKNKVAVLLDRGLSDQEIDALVAFLGSLDCGGTLAAPTLPK